MCLVISLYGQNGSFTKGDARLLQYSTGTCLDMGLPAAGLVSVELHTRDTFDGDKWPCSASGPSWGTMGCCAVNIVSVLVIYAVFFNAFHISSRRQLNDFTVLGKTA